MRIHITGMSPRMVSGRARARISFAPLLADSLVASGYDVVRDGEHHDDVDLVVVGVSAVLSPAASYAYNALGILARAVRDDVPVMVMVDDPQLTKVRDSVSSAVRDPDRLWSDFLFSKRTRSGKAFSRDEVVAGLDVLNQRMWPQVLVPLHGWTGGARAFGWQLGIDTEVIGIDLSPVFDIQMMTFPFERPETDAQMWMCEQAFVKSSIPRGRSKWPIISAKNDPSWLTLDAYGAMRGVYQGGTRPTGWWTPTPQFAARAGSIYATDTTNEGYLLGTPYYKTIDEIERLSIDAQRELAAEQADHLKDMSWDLTTLTSALKDAIGRATSSSKQDTSPAPS